MNVPLTWWTTESWTWVLFEECSLSHCQRYPFFNYYAFTKPRINLRTKMDGGWAGPREIITDYLLVVMIMRRICTFLYLELHLIWTYNSQKMAFIRPVFVSRKKKNYSNSFPWIQIRRGEEMLPLNLSRTIMRDWRRQNGHDDDDETKRKTLWTSNTMARLENPIGKKEGFSHMCEHVFFPCLIYSQLFFYPFMIFIIFNSFLDLHIPSPLLTSVCYIILSHSGSISAHSFTRIYKKNAVKKKQTVQ